MTKVTVALALACALPAVAAGVQGNRSRSLGPGRCGPVDPSHIRVSSETGGQPFFFSPAELGSSADIIGETSGSLSQLLLWASAAPGPDVREYVLPVDTRLGRLAVAASFDRPDGVLHVLAPDGRPAQSLDGTRETVYTCGHFVVVDTPPAGAWTLRVSGSGRYWLTAHGRSGLGFSASFVEPPDDRGSIRPLKGDPVVGQPALLHAEVSNSNVRVASMRLMAEDGRLLGQAAYAVDLERRESVHAIDLPSVPFRVALVGVDRDGAPFQRVHPGLFRGATIELRGTGDATLAAGRATQLRFVLRNHGPRASFHMAAYAGGSYPAAVTPATVAVDSGGEAMVTVTVSVPAGTSAGSTVTLTVTAEVPDDPRARNAVVQALTVTDRDR